MFLEIIKCVIITRAHTIYKLRIHPSKSVCAEDSYIYTTPQFVVEYY